MADEGHLPQFWIIDYDPDPNFTLNKVREAANSPDVSNPGNGDIRMVALVDEVAGGIIGYLVPEYANFIATKFPVKEEGAPDDMLSIFNPIQTEALDKAYEVAGQVQEHARDSNDGALDLAMGDLLSELDRIKRGKED